MLSRSTSCAECDCVEENGEITRQLLCDICIITAEETQVIVVRKLEGNTQ